VGWLIVATDLPDAALAILGIAKNWARSSIWLLRVICNTKVEYRGSRQDSGKVR